MLLISYLFQTEEDKKRQLKEEFPDDAYLMVSQLRWEDDVVWNGDDIKQKVTKKSVRKCLPVWLSSGYWWRWLVVGAGDSEAELQDERGRVGAEQRQPHCAGLQPAGEGRHAHGQRQPLRSRPFNCCGRHETEQTDVSYTFQLASTFFFFAAVLTQISWNELKMDFW